MPSTLQTNISLPSGNKMPILGFGVFENNLCSPACKHALEIGYRHIDSAEYYHNEVEVGKAVKESGISREEIFYWHALHDAATKIYHPDCGFESTLSHVDTSLSKFKFEYIDLYLIHSPLSGKERRLATYRALLTMRDAGKIKDVGVSNLYVSYWNHNGVMPVVTPGWLVSGIKHLEQIAEAGLDAPAVNQIEIHPYCQQRPISAYCKEHGIVVQAYSPLARGKETSTHLLEDPVLIEISQKHRKTPAQVALRWSLQRGFVPLPKSATPERIQENAEIFDFQLTEDEMYIIDGLDKGEEGAVTWNPVDVD